MLRFIFVLAQPLLIEGRTDSAEINVSDVSLQTTENSVFMASPSAGGGCSAGSCGSTSAQMNALPDDVRARVQDHPCYSEDAHHYFARMHAAVA